LYEDWATLFEDMPERFMVGTDEKFGREREEKYEKKIGLMRKILGSLDPAAAGLIGHENAERIFR
jgi:hypothetical protein